MTIIDTILVMGITGLIVAVILHNGYKKDARVPLLQFIVLAAGVSVVIGGFTGMLLPYREYTETEIAFALVVLFGVEVLVFGFVLFFDGDLEGCFF